MSERERVAKLDRADVRVWLSTLRSVLAWLSIPAGLVSQVVESSRTQPAGLLPGRLGACIRALAQQLVPELLDEARQVVYPDYATILRAHRIIKVFDAAGVQRYQNYPLGKSSFTASVTVG